jgi:hypothetical protein
MILFTDKDTLEKYRAIRESQGVRCDDDLCGVFRFFGASQGIFDCKPLAEPQHYREYTRQEWIDANLEHLRKMRAVFAECHEKDIPIYMDFNSDRLKIYLIGDPYNMESLNGDFPGMPFSGCTNMDCVNRFIANNPKLALRFKRVNTLSHIIWNLDELIEKKIARCEKYLKRYAYKINLV